MDTERRIRLYIKKESGDPHMVARFNLAFEVWPGVFARLNDGLVERNPRYPSHFWVTYPAGPNGPPWLFVGPSQRFFDRWLIGQMVKAQRDDRWESGRWFQVE